MKNVIEYDDDVIFHPGFYVEEMIRDGFVSTNDACEFLSMDKEMLWRFVNGGIDVDENLSQRLHEMTGTSAVMWINLQNAFDDGLAKHG